MVQDTITYNKLKDLISTSIFAQSDFTERLLGAVSPFFLSPHPVFSSLGHLQMKEHLLKSLAE